MTQQPLRVIRMTGSSLASYLPDVARLRIEVFRDFPYLYDGDYDYESGYLRTYIDAPDAVVVLAFDGDAVVGASTAVPMCRETEEFKRPFVEAGYDPAQIFYLGESVLLKPYRGRGIGGRFFVEREAHAAEVGDFDYAAFCAVERPDTHPRRPVGYRPLDRFWMRRGYVHHPELRTTYVWRDLDEDSPTPKPMSFWLKPI